MSRIDGTAAALEHVPTSRLQRFAEFATPAVAEQPPRRPDDPCTERDAR